MINRLKEKIVYDLEETFRLALEMQDYQAAIKAKQLIAKIQGIIDAEKNKSKILSLTDFSEQELEALIAQAEAMKEAQVQKKLSAKL